MAKKRKKIIGFVLILAIIAAVVGVKIYSDKKDDEKAAASSGPTLQEYTVVRGNISKSIMSSGYTEPLDSRTIRSSKDANIEKVYVTEGQIVKKDEVIALYEVDSEDISNELEIQKTKVSLSSAISDLNDLNEQFRDLNVYAENSGTVKFFVDEGDDVAAGDRGKIAQINVINTIKVKSMFSQSQINNIVAGDSADVFFPDYLLTLQGEVSSVDNTPVTDAKGVVGYEVEVDIAYKGAVKKGTPVNVTVKNNSGTYASPFFGEAIDNEIDEYYAPASGKVEKLYVNEGEYVEKGKLIAKLSSQDLLYKIENQKVSIEEKRQKLEDLNEDDTAITSPIDGVILSVEVSDADYVERGNPMFTIANIDKMMVNLEVDELDIITVEKGQKADITCDVFEGESFEGLVDTISLNGKSSNGVTKYDVTVKIDDIKNLMAGMNLDIEIKTAEAENVLIVPTAAVRKMRGQYIVFIIDANGERVSTPVEVGLANDENTEIVSGLNEGDVVSYMIGAATSGTTGKTKTGTKTGTFVPGMKGGGGR